MSQVLNQTGGSPKLLNESHPGRRSEVQVSRQHQHLVIIWSFSRAPLLETSSQGADLWNRKVRLMLMLRIHYTGPSGALPYVSEDESLHSENGQCCARGLQFEVELGREA